MLSLCMGPSCNEFGCVKFCVCAVGVCDFVCAYATKRAYHGIQGMRRSASFLSTGLGPMAQIAHRSLREFVKPT